MAEREMELNLDELDPSVKAHIEGLESKVSEFESKSAEADTKLEELSAQQEAKNKSLKDKLKAEGDLKSLVAEQELELEQLKADKADKKRLEKTLRETVNARAADLPEKLQEMVKAMPAEVALQYMDDLIETQGKVEMPDTGGGFQTGSRRSKRFTLDSDQAQAAKWFSVSHDAYRDAVHNMNTQEVF